MQFSYYIFVVADVLLLEQTHTYTMSYTQYIEFVKSNKILKISQTFPFFLLLQLILWNSAITQSSGPSKSPRYSQGLVIAEVPIFTGK